MTKRQYPLPADYFRCPELTPEERAYFVALGDKTFAAFLEKTVVAPDTSVRWRSAGRHHGVRLLEAHGRRFDQGVVPFRAIAKVHGTLQEVAALHDFDSRDKCLRYLRQHDATADLLDVIPLYTFIERSPAAPSLHQVYVKWVAMESPVPMIHDRDYLYLETQNEFFLPSGQRGWAYVQHSITLPSVPPLRNHTGLNLVRGSLYHTGCIFLESDETPGVLDVTYHIASDFKGAMPQWVRRLGLKRRAQNVAKVNDLIHEARLSACRMRTQLECRPTITSKHCHLCDRSFALRRPRNCHACGHVVCSRCSKPWRLTGIFLQGSAAVCICHACSNAVRDGAPLDFGDETKLATHTATADDDDDDRPSIIIIPPELSTRDRRLSSLSRPSSFRGRPSITPSRKPSRRNSIKSAFRASVATPSSPVELQSYASKMHRDLLDVASATETVDFARLQTQLQAQARNDALEAIYKQLPPGHDRFVHVETDSDAAWDSATDNEDDEDSGYCRRGRPRTNRGKTRSEREQQELRGHHEQGDDPRDDESSPSTVDLSYLNEIYRHTMSSVAAEERPSYWESEAPILDYRKSRLSEYESDYRRSRVSEYDPSRRSAVDELNALIADTGEESKEEPPAPTGFRVQAPPGTKMYPVHPPAPRPVYDNFGFATPFTIDEEATNSQKSQFTVNDALALADDDALSSLNTSRSYQTTVLNAPPPTDAADDDEKHFIVPTSVPLSDNDGMQRLLAVLAKQQAKTCPPV
ncbi:hypothetical protein ACHHYP_10358 [Achlya hypogyna]|uniref:FYVE-type domain-containing protein n=1 Tax=Achlya hypogyna TaxID=1202772 RepID=A0A1V9YLK2_ACHHY|nr:hypothetical protein ACHHYP_10358 [Achlya hypogyna]